MKKIFLKKLLISAMPLLVLITINLISGRNHWYGGIGGADCGIAGDEPYNYMFC